MKLHGLLSKFGMKFFFFLSLMLSATICFSQIIVTNETLHSKGKSKYVVFKLDDLHERNWRQFKTITDIIINKDITADIGIFAQSLLLGDKEYLVYVQSLVEDPRHFQIFMHGYTGTPKEFFDSDYDTQLEHFYLARTTMLEKCDLITRVYSSHYYGVNEHTIKIVNEDPFIKWVVWKTDDDYSAEKQGLATMDMRMEGVGKPDYGNISYKSYLSNWKKIDADTLSYIVLNGHPAAYTTAFKKNNLQKVADDLLKKGFTFIHLADYRRMLEGYLKDSTSPSIPQGFKALRTDDLHVSLSWNPSVDAESGVDCYKIYRDGVCIGLSAVPSYIDSVSGSHNYQVAAVNKNDLVSGKSAQESVY